MRPHLLALSFVLAACTASERPTCDWESERITDPTAEVAPGLSVDAMLAPRDFAAVDAKGAPLHAQVVFEPSDEVDATWRQGTPGTIRKGPPIALSTQVAAMHVFCDDQLTVAAFARLTSDRFDVDVEGTLVGHPDGQLAFTHPHQAVRDDWVLPDGPWTDDPSAQLALRLRFEGDDVAAVTLGVWWDAADGESGSLQVMRTD